MTRLRNNKERSRKAAYTFLRNNGYRTGSRVWKVHRPDSDHDYILSPENYENFLLIRGIRKVITPGKGSAGGEEDTHQNFYFEYRGRVFNVIGTTSDDWYCAWCWATECLTALPHKRSQLMDRDTRLDLFQQLKRGYIQFLEIYINNSPPDWDGTGEDVPF